MMTEVFQRNDVKGNAGAVTAHQPLSLKKMDPALVAALSALQGKSLETEVGHETWRLRFSGKAGPGAGSDIAIDAQWQGHRIAARIPRALLERTLAICVPELSLRDIPDELLTPTASNLIGMWLTKLPYAESLRIDDIAVIDTNAGDHATSNESRRIHILACRDAIEYSIALDLDPALLCGLASLCRDFPSRLPDPVDSFPHLLLLLQCEIGKVSLPYATLKTLRLGDILFFDGCMESDGANSAGIALQLTHRGYPLLRTRHHSPDLMVVTDITMNDRKPFRFEDLLDDSDSALFNPDGAIDDFDDDDEDVLSNAALPARQPAGRSSDNPGNLSQLPLQLIFDVGECEMRLSELQALQPGSVIPLASCRTDMVRIRVNGSVIASGELVEIDGKVGVMLARLAEVQ